jgi:hypothetical protein
MSILDITGAYKEGWQTAVKYGCDAYDRNPYPVGSADNKSWEKGYIDSLNTAINDHAEGR